MNFCDQNTAWFLAQHKPNCAHIAIRNLERQGFKTFLPMEDITRQRKGKFVTARRPLFSGYAFVAINVSLGLWRAVNSTYGITRLVSFGREPAVVPQELITEIMLRCDTSGILLPAKFLKPGDQVKLTKGPFADFLVEIEHISQDRRVWVLMDIMGGQTRVALNAEQVPAI